MGTNQLSSLTIEALNNCFEEARDSGYRYIGFIINYNMGIKDLIAIHESSSIDDQEHYNLFYDKCLEYKHANGIRIIRCAYGNSVEEVKRRLA